MIPATNGDKPLRRRDGVEERAALRGRDDMVIVAVHDEYWHRLAKTIEELTAREAIGGEQREKCQHPATYE